MHNISFTQAIHDATKSALDNNPNVLVLGLGVSYKNGADGTMGDLGQLYPTRVLDTPVSEAAVTGMAVGAAITGLRPIVHHGRVEFALFAIDQIVNQAAKWNYQFGGNNPVPIVFRIAIGRQWGNGPQHTQSLCSLFAAVPGLKVVVPSSPRSAKGLLTAAIKDYNPVVFLEPRWLYKSQELVEDGEISLQLDKARIVKTGTDVTIISYGEGILEAMKAIPILEKLGISAEVVDMVSINPIDTNTIGSSVSKTKAAVMVEMCSYESGVGSTVLCNLEFAKIHVACENVPCPTATSLTKAYYPTYHDIVIACGDVCGVTVDDAILPAITFDEYNLSPQFTFKF